MNARAISVLEDKVVGLVESGRYGGARSAINRLLARDKTNITGHFQMALVQMELGHLHAAFKHAKTVLRLNPKEPNAWLNLGAIAERMGKISMAISCYEKELARNPESPEALFNLGMCLHWRKKWREALRPLQECVRLRHCFDLVRIPLADCLYRCGRINDEIALYEKCLLENPPDLWARSNLGAALMDVGNRRRALINLRIAKLQGATFPNLFRNLRKLEHAKTVSKSEAKPKRVTRK